MQDRITFEDLIEIYRHTAFDPQGDGGTLSIVTSEMMAIIRAIDESIEVQKLAGVAILDDDFKIGEEVRLRIGRPARSLGVLAGTFDDFLLAPHGCSVEPRSYYVRDGALTRDMSDPPRILKAFREALALKDLLGEAAAYLDPLREELMFVGPIRVPIPVRYDAAALQAMSMADVRSLIGAFNDEIHREQKLSILANAVVSLCSGKPIAERFTAILLHIGVLVGELRDGYRLIASEFSYAKIRRDVETAQFDYLNKIHKTFTDIQGQLLGIPVATFVVASQLKAASGCNADYWTDAGAVAGAWIFVILLLIAIANQWFTLNAVASEVRHQRTTLAGDYAAVADRFADVFCALRGRIRLHRTGLVVIGCISVAGALLASLAFRSLVSVDFGACLSAAHAPLSIELPSKASTAPDETRPPSRGSDRRIGWPRVPKSQ